MTTVEESLAFLASERERINRAKSPVTKRSVQTKYNDTVRSYNQTKEEIRRIDLKLEKLQKQRTELLEKNQRRERYLSSFKR